MEYAEAMTMTECTGDDWNADPKLVEQFKIDDAASQLTAEHIGQLKELADFLEYHWHGDPRATLVKEAAAALAEREKLYMELIMAVANKYPNESRHETALRYILEREASSSDEAKCDALRSRS